MQTLEENAAFSDINSVEKKIVGFSKPRNNSRGIEKNMDSKAKKIKHITVLEYLERVKGVDASERIDKKRE